MGNVDKSIWLNATLTWILIIANSSPNYKQQFQKRWLKCTMHTCGLMEKDMKILECLQTITLDSQIYRLIMTIRLSYDNNMEQHSSTHRLNITCWCLFHKTGKFFGMFDIWTINVPWISKAKPILVKMNVHNKDRAWVWWAW